MATLTKLSHKTRTWLRFIVVKTNDVRPLNRRTVLLNWCVALTTTAIWTLSSGAAGNWSVQCSICQHCPATRLGFPSFQMYLCTK